MEASALSDHIGVSTLCLKGIGLNEAIDRTLEAGFAAFELTPITYGGPEAFDRTRRQELRRRLEAFQVLTVHSSGMAGANICSSDLQHRELSRRRYMELVTFARDVGAHVLTLHPGRLDGNGASDDEVRAQNVAFGKTLVEAAAGSTMKLGYELFDEGIAREIGSPSFGVLFDVGHASCRGQEVDTTDVLHMIDELAEQIVQFHVHGVGEAVKKDHLAFSQNAWLDYDRIVRHIRRMPFAGPLIFEIGIRQQDAQQNLKDCAQAREALLRAWQAA